ncbi:MAG: hypothetical protein ACRDQA_02495 [Nocardioidaceae bacterium]
MTAKFTQCRYLKPRSGEQCTGESVVTDPDDGVLLCQRHLALAMAMVADRKKTADSFTQRLTQTTGRKTA